MIQVMILFLDASRWPSHVISTVWAFFLKSNMLTVTKTTQILRSLFRILQNFVRAM